MDYKFITSEGIFVAQRMQESVNHEPIHNPLVRAPKNKTKSQDVYTLVVAEA